MEHPTITNLNRTGTPDGKLESPLPLCSLCGGKFYAEELKEYGGDNLCEDCLENRVQGDFTADKGKEYIKQNEKDFYLDYWFNNLSDSEKLTVAKSWFATYEERRPYAAKETIKDYCFDGDYVKWRIRNEAN